MSSATRCFFLLVLSVLVAVVSGQTVAQQVELKEQILGTGYDRETRTVSGKLPAEEAVVKRVEQAQVTCLTVLAATGETVVYHVWVYRGDEKSGLPPQISCYDSLTKESKMRPPSEALAVFPDLRELTDIRAGLVVKLRVGKSGSFRVHSVKRIDAPPSLGSWECRVYDAEGKLLGKKSFAVSAS